MLYTEMGQTAKKKVQEGEIRRSVLGKLSLICCEHPNGDGQVQMKIMEQARAQKRYRLETCQQIGVWDHQGVRIPGNMNKMKD